MTIMKSLIAPCAVVLGLLSSSAAASLEQYKHMVLDARQLKVGDSIDEFMPPLRVCVVPNDPKFAEALRKQREFAAEMRRKHGWELDGGLPACKTLDRDPGLDIQIRTVEAGEQARICFGISSAYNLGPVDAEARAKWERDEQPLYCALVSSRTSAKVWGAPK